MSGHDGSHTGAVNCPLCLQAKLRAKEVEIDELRRELYAARRDAASSRRRAERAEDSNRALRRVRDELTKGTR